MYNADDFSHCPLRGKKFAGLTNPEKLTNIAASTDCSAKCLEKSSCLYWTWMDPYGTDPSSCMLNEGFTSVVYDSHALSGDRECDGNPLGDEQWVTCLPEVDPSKVLEVGQLIIK